MTDSKVGQWDDPLELGHPAQAHSSWRPGESNPHASGTSWRNSASVWARVRARVVSTTTFGPAHPTVGSEVIQPAGSRHHDSADRSVDRCRARVAVASG